MTRIPEQALYTAEQVRELDRRAIEEAGEDGYALMGRAGAAAYRRLRSLWTGTGSMVVLAGPGNNGGDGYVMARLAREDGIPAMVLPAVDGQRLQGDAARARADWLACGGEEFPAAAGLPSDTGVIVDALLGTGLTRPPEGRIAELVSMANAHPASCFAVDVPTGLDADTGMLLGEALAAENTATFIGRKRGLHTGMAAEVTGRVHFERLEVPELVYRGLEPSAFLTERGEVSSWLQPRRATAHKGEHGRVVLLGGDHGMGGAILLAAEAAARAGAGQVVAVTRRQHHPAMLARAPWLMPREARGGPELRGLLRAADAVVVGPGLGRHRWGRRLWRQARALRRPMVADADALNLLAESRHPELPHGTVITPHPGEAARLLESNTASIQTDRFASAAALAGRTGAVSVLKGAGSLVAAPGNPVRVCDAGNPGMGVAGMGDVLAGIIGSLMAQGLPPAEAATAGTWLHATAGDMAARELGQRGLQPGDLLAPLMRLVNPPGRHG